MGRRALELAYQHERRAFEARIAKLKAEKQRLLLFVEFANRWLDDKTGLSDEEVISVIKHYPGRSLLTKDKLEAADNG